MQHEMMVNLEFALKLGLSILFFASLTLTGLLLTWGAWKGIRK